MGNMMKAKTQTDEERLYMASQWELMRRKFVKHKLALVGLGILCVFVFIALFAEFLSTTDPTQDNSQYIYLPPQRMRFFDQGKLSLRPFVYEVKREIDLQTLTRLYVEDESQKYPIYFFVRGYSYRLLGLIPSDIHLMGTEGGPFFLFGTDRLGRDLFSRTLLATRVSISVGLLGLVVSFVLGCLLGGLSGYYGGGVDIIVMRIVEFLSSIPTIPLWMALSAALPRHWSSIQTYFGITIILGLVGWTGLARVVRGKLLELREEDFVTAARLAGMSDFRIITKHLLPLIMSYLIVNLTLAIPRMILGETSLSFLGLGIRPPAVSLGTLMQDAQNVRILALNPWLLIPALFVVAIVLGSNFLGDGLRDAADPYK